MNDDVTLVDATGLRCPLPVLKARKAMKTLNKGAQIRVWSTDPASPLDFRHFCQCPLPPKPGPNKEQSHRNPERSRKSKQKEKSMTRSQKVLLAPVLLKIIFVGGVVYPLVF